MIKPYDPRNWYWFVDGDETKVFSSAVGDYVQLDDATYQAWLSSGGKPTRIASEIELWNVLAQQYPAGLPAGKLRYGSFHDFMQLLTEAEQDAIADAARTSTPIKKWYDQAVAENDINMENPRLVAGMQALVGAGLITSQRHDEIIAGGFNS